MTAREVALAQLRLAARDDERQRKAAEAEVLAQIGGEDECVQPPTSS